MYLITFLDLLETEKEIVTFTIADLNVDTKEYYYFNVDINIKTLELEDVKIVANSEEYPDYYYREYLESKIQTLLDMEDLFDQLLYAELFLDVRFVPDDYDNRFYCTKIYL